MNADPATIALGTMTTLLLLFAGYVAANVMVATWPELKTVWKETTRSEPTGSIGKPAPPSN